MRIRSRNSITASTTDCKWVSSENGVPKSNGSWSQATLTPGVHESMADEVGPEFKRALRKGGYLVRPMVHAKVTLKHVNNVLECTDYMDYPGMYAETVYSCEDPANVCVYDKCPSIRLFGFEDALHLWTDWDVRTGLPFSGPLGVANTRALVLSRAYAQAGNADFLSAVSYAEMSKTLESVKRLNTMLPRFSNWLVANRKKLLTRRGLIRATGNLAEQWLEYRYGFSQLYYDFTSLVKVVTRRRQQYRIARARWAGTGHVNTDTQLTHGTISNSFLRRECAREDVITAAVVVKVSPICDRLRSVGLLSPLTTMWELIPFSFVVDWFIDVSTALAAFEGRYGCNVIASWTSWCCRGHTLDTYSEEGFEIPYNGGVWGSRDDITYSSVQQYDRFERIANPRFVATVPEFRLRLNWKRCLDTAALLRQVKHNALH